MSHKMHFRHGCVGAAKSANLLMVAFTYERQGKKVLTIKPKKDTQFGFDMIKSRAGFERKADIVVEKPEDIPTDCKGIACILVDEAQFLNAECIDRLSQLRKYAAIICYGLRTDFKTQLFEGSKRLMEVANFIEPVDITCAKCDRLAIFNLRHDSTGKKIMDGPQIQLGTEEMYSPVCFDHYYE